MFAYRKRRKNYRIFVDFSEKMRIIQSCMDTRKNSMIPKCGVEAAGRFVVGAKQLRKALQSGRARKVYLAKDADPAITAALEEQCQTANVPFVWVATMRDLGRACGIEVGAAAAAAVD